nr:ribonuclease H-like domain-containing protein [Tanacetum cinerariifolium]
MKKIDKGITMIHHTQAKAIGKLSNVHCHVGVTTIIAKFLILDIPIDYDVLIVVGRGFLYTMGSILNTPDRLFSTFDGVCHQTFQAARYVVPTGRVVVSTGRIIVATGRMQKILSQLNQLKAKPEDEDINLKFLRALPSSRSQVALTLKTKGGLKFISFDDLYYKLKNLEVDVKGYTNFSSSQSVGPSHSAFVSATSASKKMSYRDSLSYSSNTTYSTSSNSKTGSHRSSNVLGNVLQSFVTNTKPEQQLAYKDFEQIEKLDLEEMDLKWKMAMLFVSVHKFEQKDGRKIDFDKKESARFNKKKKKEEDSKALITVDTLVDWTDHDDEGAEVITAKEFGLITGCDSEDAIKEGAAKIYNLITGANSEEANTASDAGEFTLMGVTSEVHNCLFGCDNKYNELKKQYTELNEQNSKYFIQVQAYKNSLKTLEKQKRVLQRIRVLSIELENTSNLLKHSERINDDFETAKKDLQTKLDNHLVQTEKWRNSSKNLFRLINSSISVRTKVGLGFTNCISENELGWDDSAFSVFTTNSEDVEGRPIFHRFTKTNSMKAVPPPLSKDYTSLSDHIDVDESQMSYGTKSSTSCDSKSVFNDFVSCDDSDKSSEVNTNDFASSDSSVKSLEHQPNDSTSCASTSSVSTSMNEAEIESNVRTPIQEPIIVQDLPSSSCNSSDKNEHTSRTFCTKNGYFNKKAGHFRKHASSVSKLCFVCGSATHLIKDCDFHEKQMANKTVGIGVGFVYNTIRPQPVPTGKPKVSTLVPTGKPKVSTPVLTGRPNRPFPFPNDRGFSPPVISSWWSSTARPMPHSINPTSSYFQTYTPYVPTMYYHHMKNVQDIWATAVKPSTVNMASLADKAILSGAENRPPMLEKDMYDSWRSRTELYMLNRQHGRMILESVEHGPLLWPSVTEDGETRLKKYSELSLGEAIQADCDVKATNIILQALPAEIYALV